MCRTVYMFTLFAQFAQLHDLYDSAPSHGLHCCTALHSCVAMLYKKTHVIETTIIIFVYDVLSSEKRSSGVLCVG